MENTKEVKILSNRVGPRAYDISYTVDGVSQTREFSNCNNAFAAHTVLREIIYHNKNTRFNLKTNVTALIEDIKTLETNPRTLTRYLRTVIEESGSQIVSSVYEAV